MRAKMQATSVAGLEPLVHDLARMAASNAEAVIKQLIAQPDHAARIKELFAERVKHVLECLQRLEEQLKVAVSTVSSHQ